MSKLISLLAAVVTTLGLASTGCSSEPATASPESRLAETEAALSASCGAGTMGGQCLEAKAACTETDVTCRTALTGCMANEEAKGKQLGKGAGGAGDCSGGGAGAGAGGAGGGGGGGGGEGKGAGEGSGGKGGGHKGGGHFRPDTTAMAACHADARACIAAGTDAVACVTTARTCVQSVLATAFEAMCADHAAACEGSADTSCAKIAGMCNRGPRACANP